MVYTFFAGQAPIPLNLDSVGSVVANIGPSTVYYSAQGKTTTAEADGSIASGSSTILSGHQTFMLASSGARADVSITPASAISVALATGGTDIATTSTAVAVANTSRTAIVLANGSDTAMWITLASSGAAVGNGLYLPAGGGTTSLYYTGAVCAVHAGVSGTKRLGYTELA